VQWALREALGCVSGSLRSPAEGAPATLPLRALTRLETRTKESNMRASRRVHTPLRNESEPVKQGRVERAQQACWDPKDGELCLGMAKPGETLVEACRDTDVQIVLLT